MTNPLYTVTTFPATSQAAMIEFDTRYLASIGAAPPPTWSTDYGDLIPSGAPIVEYPISSLAIQYLQTEGESRFKTLLEKSFQLSVEEFDCGIQAKLLDVLSKTFAYQNWQQGPQRMLLAEGRRRNKSIAALLHGGESAIWGTAAKPIDGANFFSATHLSDFNDPDSATWSNYQATPKTVISIPNIEAEATAFQGVLDENGDEIGAEADTIFVPTPKYEPLKNLLSQNFMLAGGTSTSVTSAATSNPYVGKFKVERIPELTALDPDDWYMVDSKLRASTGLTPFITLRYMVPTEELTLRHYDASNSDWARDTGGIKVSSHIWQGTSLAFPHSIRKIKGA